MKTSAKLHPSPVLLRLAFSITLCIAAEVGLQAQDPVPSGHSILITSVRTGDTEVFAVDPSSGDAHNLSRSPESEERYPSWSPDGRKIVFTSNMADSLTYDLYLARADGSGRRRLTSLPKGAVAYWPSWTADGKYIYYNEGNSSAVYRIKPNGKDHERIAEGRDAQVSPDGRSLVFTQRGPEGFGVWTMLTDGSKPRQVIPMESQIGGIAPVWSPDGQYIAFSGQVDNAAEIFMVKADGHELRQVTQLQQISSSPVFSAGEIPYFRVTHEACRGGMHKNRRRPIYGKADREAD